MTKTKNGEKFQSAKIIRKKTIKIMSQKLDQGKRKEEKKLVLMC